MSRVVLGVGGGIAAYKACSLLRHLTETGHDVTVVPTAAALQFVGAATWSALSGKPVTDRVWDDVHEVRHVRLGQQADLVVVAPATADVLAKAAHGLADDLLTNVLLTAHGHVLLAPAMHTEMWQHPATRANVATLRERGVTVLDPASGRLTGSDSGPGRLPEPGDIFEACVPYLNGTAGEDHIRSGDGPLTGHRIVISAGGTREALDPVRYLGNRSSGKQGIALADVALRRGAQVTLVAANVEREIPAGIHVVAVESARELREAMAAHSEGADVVVMSAAVADFRPASVAAAKIKKAHAEPSQPADAVAAAGSDRVDDGEAPTIQLVRNPDILAALVRARGDATAPVIVGFAAETGDDDGDVLHHARLKLARKGCDLLVANEVGVDLTFGKDESTVHLLRRDAAPGDPVRTVGPAPKTVIAQAVWDAVQELLGS